MMLSTANLLSPSDGGPVVAPTQDMVLGCYYLTLEREDRPATAPSPASPTSRRRCWPTRSGASTPATRVDELPEPHGPRSSSCTRPIELPRRALGRGDRASSCERERAHHLGRVIFNQILPDRLRFVEQDR